MGKSTTLIVKDKATGKQWCEQFHPMPTKRARTAAVCTGKALVVAAGVESEFSVCTIVEVMDTKTSQWSTARSLPPNFYGGSATVCGDCLYLMEGKTVLTCSLSNLFQSCQPQLLIARIKSVFTRRETVSWQRVANVPVSCTTCVAFNDHLLVVGGASIRQSTNNIYALNLTTNSWEVTSHMPTARSWCLVAVLPGNKLMVAGGWRWRKNTDAVEIAEMI